MSGALIIATLRFTDIERYRAYQARFPAVFQKHEGRVLAADEAPQTLEGGAVDKIVVMQFPNEAAAQAFISCPEYQDISKDRVAGAETTSWLVKALG